ncbi:MAG: peptide ABC transporter substrate-binding protein [Candidatus Eremiobacteraeota bacterium]|nr:peptide ABC transporter substrate-binding protein [Candidatus Eremiobacteraeota bacterium]
MNFRLLALLLCASTLFACSKTGGASGGHNPWTQPGHLRIGASNEPDNLNPMFGHSDATDQVDALIFAPLFRYKPNGDLNPELATEIPTYTNGGISRDNKTLTIHMRKGVLWSDGKPLTARDWLFTYHAVMNDSNNTKLRFGWDSIASVSLPNDHTIVIHLKQPNATFLGVLAQGGSAYPPLPEHLLGKLPNLNRASFNTAPISSGPFVLTQWNHGGSLELIANPHYWRGRPKLNRITIAIVPDNNTLFNEIKTHEIDLTQDSISENLIPQLSSITGITVVKRLSASWRHMGINISRPTLSDVRVRLAIAQAIDWKQINDKIYRGYNQLAVSDVFPESWAAPTIPRYPYDPAHAKALLAQAGWRMGPDGVLHKEKLAMHLTISTGINGKDNEASEVVIQSQLKPLGIDVQVRNYPTSLLFAQNGPLYTGHYDLEWSLDTNAPDPDNSGSWASAYIPPKGANTSWLRDPIVDKASAEALLTFDRAKRKALYQREEEAIHADVPAVFFYWENSYVAYNTDLKNYSPTSYLSNYWNPWEWEI